MSTIDQQFVEFIVKTLVNNPDKVIVEREIDERGVLLSLTVDPEDVGRVIGKRGATAQSLRTLLRVLGTKNGARYNLKIINTDEDGVVAESTNKTTKAEFDPKAAPQKSDTAESENLVDEEPSEEEPAEKEQSDEEPEESDLAAKTRAELADLDDLDI